MKNIITILTLLILVSVAYCGDGSDISLPKLKSKKQIELRLPEKNINTDNMLQLKKRKTVSSYFGAGYSFIIFTDAEMNTAYPVFDISKGDFLTEVNLFFGFSIAKALTLEIEPSIIYSSNQRVVHYQLKKPKTIDSKTFTWSHPQKMSLLSFPLAMNVRFFPMYKQAGFARLFFIGGGVGAIWIREEYDNYYNNYAGGPVYGDVYAYTTESTSQWQPIFRGMIGFTGAGGQFGFGGELRYNFVPLTQTDEPFASRFAKNFNSVDLSIRFYFSL